MSTATLTESKFTAKAGKLITLDVVGNLIAGYRAANEGKKGVVDSIFFGKEKLMDLLTKPGATGLRLHFGIDEKGEQKIIIFPAGENGANMSVKNAEGFEVGLDWGLPCPHLCPTED
jgi:hypothetical protein